MAKILAALIVLGMLPGCAGTPDWSVFGTHVFGRKPAVAGHYSFDWQLSGNREVAPLQVFDDGHKTWLQFAPGQPVPAIFEQRAEGDRPLSYKLEGPYVVLDGVWPELVLRGGQLKSTVRRVQQIQSGGANAVSSSIEGPAAATAVTEPEPAVVLVAAGDPAAGVPAAGDPAPGDSAAAARKPPIEVLAPEASSSAIEPDRQNSMAIGLAVERHAVSLVGPERYEVSPRDLTLRAALSRWAQSAGWTFEAEHWAVDADIPVAGSASFELPFKPAVQELVSATELADRPVQPCFYSNRVLRIVPYAQTCDRSAGTQRSS